MPSLVVVGAQWGDEGKGKIIDILTNRAQHVVRAQGGNNAGHTILIGKDEFKLHLVPSGILHPHTQCYIGSGTVLDLDVLMGEIDGLTKRGIQVAGRLWISPGAHVIMPFQKLTDRLMEERKGPLSVGTTGRGIGPCYADKAHRVGVRVATLLNQEVFEEHMTALLPVKNDELSRLYDETPLELAPLLHHFRKLANRIREMVAPVEQIVYRAVREGKHLLFEGAQGTFLDLNSGTYPYVTSSNTVAAGICVGAGIGPSHVDHVLGVVKAYTTRVGNGPLPSQLQDHEVFLDHDRDREKGTTTGRLRRVGWFDALLVKESVRLNSLHSIALTKVDVLDRLPEIKICTHYRLDGQPIDYLPYLAEDLARVQPQYITLPGWQRSTQDVTCFEELPEQAKQYVCKIEDLCEVPVSILSLGPERERTLILRDPFLTEETFVP